MRAAKVLVALSVLWAVPVWATAVDISLEGRALLGKGMPSLNVQILEPIAGFRVKLKRSDGKELDIKGGGKPGVVRNVVLSQPEGSFKYSGELIVNFPNGTSSSMPLEFDAELLGPLKIESGEKDLDMEARKLVFRLNRPAAKAHLKVLSDTGGYVMDDEVLFNGEPAGTPLELTWPKSKGTVMKIELVATDTSTVFGNMYIYPPWHVEIPHEEVNFDTGKWEIRDSETGKLDKSYGLIRDAVQKYGQFAEIKLFIAGHTDSVGDHASNRTLSLNRARSIGQYLKKRGLRMPILYEGFGEEALRVKTPDETDEPQNRRAEYLISIERPKLNNPPFPPNWQKL